MGLRSKETKKGRETKGAESETTFKVERLRAWVPASFSCIQEDRQSTKKETEGQEGDYSRGYARLSIPGNRKIDEHKKRRTEKKKEIICPVHIVRALLHSRRKFLLTALAASSTKKKHVGNKRPETTPTRFVPADASEPPSQP